MKPNNSSSGIYYYKNKINGKLYIGQAKNLYLRHKNIYSSKYCGGIFDKALRKYGVKNFEYGILKHCLENELDKWEQFYIKRLKTKFPNGYNLTNGGNSSAYEYVVVQCDRLKHDKVLNVFESLSEAKRLTNIYSIHKCINGYQENAGGYFWRRGNELDKPSKKHNKEFLKPLDNNHKLTNEQKQKLKEKKIWEKPHLKKKIYCFDKNNNIVNTFETSKDAGKKYNICYKTISDICLGKRKNKYINGITFSYNKNYKVEPFTKTKILQYTLDGKLVKEYDSIRTASKATKAKEGSISSCISGRYKTSVGYVWKKEIIAVK